MSDRWWIRMADESEQDWLNRIEDHNPSESDEVRLAHLRKRIDDKATR